MNLFLQEFLKESYYLLGKGKIYMKIQYLVIALVFAMLSVGCSDKSEVPNELNKQSEVKKKILEDNEHEFFKDEDDTFTVKPHKKILCQKGCDDVPKNSVEYKNCVLRNCPDAKFF